MISPHRSPASQLAGDVKNPFGRVCAYGLVGALTVAAVVGCAGIRQLEAQFERNVRNG